MLLIGEYTEFPAWLPADPGSGIALFNSTEGAEPFANTVLSVHNPSFLCADGYGGFYALDEGSQGLLTHFIPDGKSFYLAEQVEFESQGSCHLCVSPEHKIYISNYDSGTLTVVSDNNGHLEVIQTLYFHGGGPVKSRQSASHIHSCRLSPNGRELFAADLGGDRLYRFDIQKDGRLNKHIEQPYIQLPGGSGPRHMDFHPNSRFMYISAELSNQIFTLCFNENGVASVVSCISTTECKGPTILTAHLQVSEQYNMPKFNPHPLFPENPLYEIHSEAEIPHSDRYELWCDGLRQTVYHTDSFDYAVVVRKNSEHFPVEIHVSTAFKDVVIRPLSVGISFERKEDVIRFTLPGPVKISVELDGNLKTPLFILTTNYVAPPDPAPAYFFRKGHVYNVGSLELKSGECAYLEEGSIVCGRIFSYKADCVSVLGNGILYGSVWHKPDENGGRLMAAFTLGDDIRIQGITIVDSGVWNLVPGACRNVSICDVNILSRLVTGDGIDIVGCENVTIENCFIRACDDCICIKACPLPSPAACCNVKNVHVHGCTLWNAEPGNALEIGYELRCNEVSDIVFSDCDIIHCEYEGNQSGGVLTIHNADHANVHNILYENIRIEDAQEKFVDIKILDSKYSLDRVRGDVQDVTFRNITVGGSIFPVSIIRGFEMHNEMHRPRHIRFENVVVHGALMHSANEMRMVVELAHELEFEGNTTLKQPEY